MPLKRYLVFAGKTYYPNGGWDDFYGHYATEEEGRVAMAKAQKTNDWAHIVDILNHKVLTEI